MIQKQQYASLSVSELFITVHFIFCYSTNLIDLCSFHQKHFLKNQSSFAPVVPC